MIINRGKLASRYSLAQLIRPISTDIIQVEKRIKILTANNDGIPDADLAKYLIGGKRLRSSVILLIGKMLNADMDPIYSLAASVEMLHSATLAHDDLMDGGITRRNQASGKSIPLQISILVGDYLLAQSTAALASLGDPALMKIHSDILLTTCVGEYQQWNKSGYVLSKQTYYDIIQKKTASLFAGAAEMAAVLSKVDSRTSMMLRDYGLALGTVYQISDDILDLVGDELVLGKTLRQDLRKGIITLPMILHHEQKHDISWIQQARQLDDYKILAIIEDLKKSGAIDASLNEAEEYVTSCKKALSGLPEGAFHSALVLLADYVINQGKPSNLEETHSSLIGPD